MTKPSESEQDKRTEMVRKRWLVCKSAATITRETGIPRRTVTRIIAKLKKISQTQAFDMKASVAQIDARFDERLAWLHSMRGACRSSFEASKIAQEETRIDVARSQLYLNIGYFTMASSVYMDEQRLEEGANLPLEVLKAQMAERVRLLIESRSGLSSPAIDK